MTTTNPQVRVAIEAAAGAVIGALLAPRRTTLHRRAPRNASTHQLRRSIQCGKARPVHMLLQLAADDLADGVPIPEVEEPFHELLQAVRALAASCSPPTSTQLMVFMRAESKAEAALRDCELDAVRDPDSLTVLERLSLAVSRRESAADRLAAAIRARRLALLAHPGRTALRTA